MNNSKSIKAWITWVALAAAVILPFLVFGERVDAWIKGLLDANEGNMPVMALVLFAVLSADIFLPVPSCLLSALCGMMLGPYCGFAVSFAAMSVSALAGYAIGRFMTSLAARMLGSNSRRIENIASSRSAFMLFVLRPVPVLAECSCVYAGINRYPFKASTFWLTLGNATVSAVYAVIGHLGRADDSFVPAFAAVIVLSGLGWACGKFL